MENTQIPGSFLRGRDLSPAVTQAALPSRLRAPRSDWALDAVSTGLCLAHGLNYTQRDFPPLVPSLPGLSQWLVFLFFFGSTIDVDSLEGAGTAPSRLSQAHPKGSLMVFRAVPIPLMLTRATPPPWRPAAGGGEPAGEFPWRVQSPRLQEVPQRSHGCHRLPTHGPGVLQSTPASAEQKKTEVLTLIPSNRLRRCTSEPLR